VQPYAVRSVLDSRHVTGIRVFRGLDAGQGDWPAIIDRGTWSEVQERRAYRSSAHDRRGWRFYLLRGLVVCKKCGWRMAGSASKDACYCAKHTYLGAQRCHRRIGAARLEAFVTDAAVDLLTHLDVTGTPSATTAPVCDGRGGDQRSLDGHGSGSQVRSADATVRHIYIFILPR
jgi:site-specific DNA recombinase